VIKLSNTAIRLMVVQKSDELINSVNKNFKENSGAVISYTSLSGNTVDVEHVLDIVGGDANQRNPNAECGTNGDCGYLDLKEYSGYTHYYSGCFTIKDSELKAKTNGKSQIGDVSIEIGKIVHNKIANLKTDLAILSLKSAIVTESNLVQYMDTEIGTPEYFTQLRKAAQLFGNNRTALKTILLDSINAEETMVGLNVAKECKLGSCAYYTVSMPVSQKTIYQVESPEAEDTGFILQPGAVKIRDIELDEFVIRETGKAGNICYEISYAGAFDVQIKGYNFDESLSKNPTVGEIGSNMNWKLVTDKAGSAGVLLMFGA